MCDDTLNWFISFITALQLISVGVGGLTISIDGFVGLLASPRLDNLANSSTLVDPWIISLVDLVVHCIIGLIDLSDLLNHWLIGLIGFGCISGLVDLISLINLGIIGLIGLLALLAHWLIDLVGFVGLSTHQLHSCLAAALIVAAAKTTRRLKHAATHGVAMACLSATKITNATISYYCATSSLDVSIHVRETI